MKKLILHFIRLFFGYCIRQSKVLVPVFTSEYFPLQVGNKLVFISSFNSATWSCEITDTKIFGEHVYFERVLTFSDGTNIIIYFRVAENNLELIYIEERDYIFMVFKKPVNEGRNSYGENYGYIRQRNISTQEEAGSFDNVTEVVIDRSVSDAFGFSHFAPGVGVLNQSGSVLA